MFQTLLSIYFSLIQQAYSCMNGKLDPLEAFMKRKDHMADKTNDLVLRNPGNAVVKMSIAG